MQFRRDELRTLADNNGWHLYMPSGTWPGAEPLLARKSMFRWTSSGDRGSTFVCDTGGSADPPPPRYLTWISWEHIPSGRNVNHINSHLNAHIDDNGSPYDLPRTGDAEKHIRMIRDLAVNRSSQGQVVVSGDFNADYQDERVQFSRFAYSVLEERQAAGAIPGLRSGYSQLGLRSSANYSGAGSYFGQPFSSEPERVRTLAWSAKVARWYWTVARTGTNGAADSLDMGLVSRYIGYAACSSEDLQRCEDFKRAMKHLTGVRPADSDVTCLRH